MRYCFSSEPFTSVTSASRRSLVQGKDRAHLIELRFIPSLTSFSRPFQIYKEPPDYPPGGRGTWPIFGYRWATESLKTLTLFRTTPSILLPCLEQRTKCTLSCFIKSFIDNYNRTNSRSSYCFGILQGCRFLRLGVIQWGDRPNKAGGASLLGSELGCLQRLYYEHFAIE